MQTSLLTGHEFSRTDSGGYNYRLDERVADRRPRFAQAVIQTHSLDGAETGIPQATLIELAHVFSWDIDFVLDIRRGDEFSLIYGLFPDGEQLGNILIARFKTAEKSTPFAERER